MLTPHLRCLALSGALPLLAASGCGLVDDSIQGRSPASWCEEAGVGDVAEVEISQQPREDGPLDVSVVLRDAEGRTLAEIQLPTDLSEARRRVYKLDAAGNVIEVTTDRGMDGTLDSIETSSYDEQGRPAVTSIDDDGDGVVDEIETWDYSTPLQTTYVLDDDMDGDPDAIETTTYAESGEPILEERDTHPIGAPEWTTTYSWSESGLVLEFTELQIGVWSLNVTYEYDEQERVVRTVETLDDQLDDEPDDQALGYTTEVTYEYDEANRLARKVTVTTDMDGTSTTEETKEYGDDGQLVAVLTSTDSDPEPERSQRFTYDEDGRLLRDERGYEPGPLSYVEEYEYGEEGDLIRRSWDFDGDNAWDWVKTWTACD